MGGDLACNADCTFDTTGCGEPCGGGCGNGIQCGTEACDGSDLNGGTCETLGLMGGGLGCGADCTFDTSGCDPICVCGDGLICPGAEACDLTDLGDATCADYGHTGGSLVCTQFCTINDSSCGTCGNGTQEVTELCDGFDTGGETCQDHGFDGGSLACNQTCDGFITSFCSNSGNTCGNGITEPGEECDGVDLGYFSCAYFAGWGMLRCNANCTFDFTGCATGDFCALWGYYFDGYCDPCELNGGVADPDCTYYCGADGHCADLSVPETGYLPSCLVATGAEDPDCNPGVCGDATVGGSEQCDGANLDGEDCTTLGYAAGTLTCDANCHFDVSACPRFPCGDATADGHEVCDGVDLKGQVCSSILQGLYTGGTLACAAACDGWNVSGCTLPTCGDGTIEGLEFCDGADLNGATCAGWGYLGGTAACDAGCKYDFSGCTLATCGDGVIEGNEPCDGTNLDGADCTDWSFTGGSLACDPSCGVFDLSGCLGSPTPP